MRHKLTLSTMILFASCMFAQWTTQSRIGLSTAFNNYSASWSGGESGSLNWGADANLLAQKQLSQKLETKSTLKLSFGQTHVQNEDTRNWASPKISSDLIDLESILRFTLQSYVDPFIAGRAETKFFDNSVRENTRALNPLKFTESAGVVRMFLQEDKKELSARFGAGFRQNIDRDVLDVLSDEKSTVTTNDGGLELVCRYRTPLANGQIYYDAKLNIYKALYFSQASELEGLPEADYWKSPDVSFEHIFSANITKVLMVGLYVQMLYDKQSDKRMQHKETLSLTVAFEPC